MTPCAKIMIPFGDILHLHATMEQCILRGRSYWCLRCALMYTIVNKENGVGVWGGYGGANKHELFRLSES